MTQTADDKGQVRIVDLMFTDKEVIKTKLQILYQQICDTIGKSLQLEVTYRLKCREEITLPKGNNFKNFFAEKQGIKRNKEEVDDLVKFLITVFTELQKEYSKQSEAL